MEKVKIVRWGILGAGRIAAKFIADLQYVKNAVVQAVGARSSERAQSFAKKNNCLQFHGSYEDLVQNPEVDIIYVATPHVFHAEHAILCMRHGKAVLCEKPVSVNLQELQQMIQVAEANQTYFMEALWTKFLPHYQTVMYWLENNKIGAIQHIEADFGFAAPFDPQARTFNAALAGGALLDIGIYPIMIILEVLGMPKTVEVSMKMAATAVDMKTTVNFGFEAQTARASCTFETQTPTICTIRGSKGSILMHSRFHENTQASLLDADGNILETTDAYAGLGYHFMAKAVMDDWLAGKKQSTIHSWKDSLRLMEVLDAVRLKGGLRYPFEGL